MAVMVQLNRNPQYYNSQEVMSTLILSIGLLSLVVSLFYGIKLKWFRYRMNIPSIDDRQVENTETMRTQSVTEIRENCSVGVYRKSSVEDILIRNDIHFNSTSIKSPSSHNGKSKSLDRESIFRWPFRNKLALSKYSSKDENRISTIGSSFQQVDKREKDPAIAEKNERIRRSIYEQLHSANSMSMPDLVQCDSSSVNSSQEITNSWTIRKGIEVEEVSQYHTVDEVQEIAVPYRAKVIPLRENSLEEKMEPEIPEIKIETNDQDEEIEIAPRPPTPIRRRSRSNSLRPLEEEKKIVEDSHNVPPVVMPRKKNINNQTNNKVPNEFFVEQINIPKDIVKNDEDLERITPKSILKTHEEHPSNQTKTSVQFINVPDSSSSDDEDYYDDKIEKIDNDVWKKIDIHREQLMKKQELNDSPPPLPNSPPPTADNEQLREYQFA